MSKWTPYEPQGRARTVPHPLAARAIARYYHLLDSGIARSNNGFAGDVAATTVGEELDVPTAVVWRWVRENTDKRWRRTRAE